MSNAQIVEACRLAYTGFEKNQRERLLKFLHKEVVFEFPPSLPYGGTYRGVDEFKAFWMFWQASPLLVDLVERGVKFDSLNQL